NEKAWYADAVTYCTERGYISGMSDNSFAPNNNLTREQFVMILSQVAGVDTEQYKNLDDGFADTKSGMWYSGAVYWAVKEGYVNGVSTDRFGLGQNITREQLARLFYLYAESVGMDVTSRADLSKFADSSKISSWASEQIKWAVSAGLISGMSEDTLSPKGTATRAQAARIFMLFDRIN
ncbi:MAG: S-layer homology domain-containing protein, partial [Clostridia bacterium]|nr:S-layer homology domain-containing protein [Clostridia bacterium]